MARNLKKLTNGTVTVTDSTSGNLVTAYTANMGIARLRYSKTENKIQFLGINGYVLDHSMDLAPEEVGTINDQVKPANVSELVIAIAELFGTTPVSVTGGSGTSESGLAKDNTLSAINNKVATDTTMAQVRDKIILTPGGKLDVNLPDISAIAKDSTLIAVKTSTDANKAVLDDILTQQSKLDDINTSLAPLADIVSNTLPDPDYVDPSLSRLDRLGVLLGNIYEALDSGILVDAGLTSGDPSTSANQTVANTSLATIATSVAGTLQVNSTINPKASNGYGSTHQAYISLDGGLGTVSITGSGDFSTASTGKVSALIKNVGIAWNNLHVDATEECWIFLYNLSTAPAAGLTTSIKHRYRVRVGANTYPLKDNQFGTGLGYTIVKTGALGGTGSVGTQATSATIMVNLNYVA